MMHGHTYIKFYCGYLKMVSMKRKLMKVYHMQCQQIFWKTYGLY